MVTEIRFQLNGKECLYSGDPLRRLLDVLREDYGLTGSKEGCGEGECGACSIIKNGELITPCIVPVASVNGAELLTIEGIRDTPKGQCLIQAFADGGAVQCGFCIPGMVLAGYVLLNKNPQPTEEEIRVGISGNICRCTGYDLIVASIRLAAERGAELWRSGAQDRSFHGSPCKGKSAAGDPLPMQNCYIPESLEEALKIRKETGAIPLAGGSDLMVSHSRGTGIAPKFEKPVLILSNLQELKGIRLLPDGTTEIGAGVCSREIAESDLVHPLLRDAASRMGAVALRNSASIGGNIGNSSPKGDMPQPLILLDAEVVLSRTDGERLMKVDDFILAAGKNQLAADELITAVRIPKQDFTHIFYRKIGMRRANAISKLTLSAAATVKNGMIADFRASSGAAGPKVERSRKAEELLIGCKVSELPEKKDAFIREWTEKVISPHAMPEYRKNSTARMLNYFIDALAAGHEPGRVE